MTTTTHTSQERAAALAALRSTLGRFEAGVVEARTLLQRQRTLAAGCKPHEKQTAQARVTRAEREVAAAVAAVATVRDEIGKLESTLPPMTLQNLEAQLASPGVCAELVDDSVFRVNTALCIVRDDEATALRFGGDHHRLAEHLRLRAMAVLHNVRRQSGAQPRVPRAAP